MRHLRPLTHKSTLAHACGLGFGAALGAGVGLLPAAAAPPATPLAPATTSPAATSPAATSPAAAPPVNPAMLAADWTRWRQTRANLLPLEQREPGVAALRYRNYLRRNPGLQPAVAVDVLVTVIDLYEDRLHDATTVAALRKWGQEKFAAAPEVTRLAPYPSVSLKSWARLQAVAQPLEASNPALAALTYWQFLAANPDAEPAIIAGAATALVPLYRDTLKDPAAGAVVRDWALRQCAGNPELIRGLNLLTSRTAAAPKPPAARWLTADFSSSRSTFAANATTREEDPVRQLPATGNFTGARVLTVAATTGTDELARVPAAARQALKTVAPPAIGTPAELWKVPPATLRGVVPPNQTWTQAMLDEQAREVVQQVRAGKLLAAPPSAANRARLALRERAAQAAFAAAQQKAAVQLKALYARATAEFWSVEPQSPGTATLEGGLASMQPGREELAAYRAAASNAEAFVALQTGAGKADRRTPVMLYIAAMSASSTQRHVPAVRAVDWLLTEYPAYRDPRQEGAADFEGAPQPELLQLRLYHLAQLAAPGALQLAVNPAAPGKAPVVTSQPAVGAATAGNTLVSNAIAPLSQATLPPYLAELLQTQSSLSLLAELAAQGTQAYGATLKTTGATTPAPTIAPDGGALASSNGCTPGQLRAAALPPLTATVPALHEALLPLALAKEGPRPVRAYLRSLLSSKPAANVTQVAAKPQAVAAVDAKHPFAPYASQKLVAIDRDILGPYESEAERAIAQKRWNDARGWLKQIISEYDGTPPGQKARDRLAVVTLAQYQDDARIALAANRFADARALFKRIQAEFPGSPAAKQAEADFKQSVPVAVTFYKTKGDENFQPSKKVGIPQVEAESYYKHMFEEDQQGPQADYALLRWSRAMGTSGKMEESLTKLSLLENNFPQSQLMAEALYTRAFILGSPKMRKYADAVSVLKKIVKDYPKSSFAPEALWHIAFFSDWQAQKEQAIAALNELQEKYPESVRSKFAPHQLQLLQQAAGQ